MKHIKDFISKVLIVCSHKTKRENYFNNTPGETVPEGFDTKALTYQKAGNCKSNYKITRWSI